jgi:tetratricopeptide (TPR) repeat protein
MLQGNFKGAKFQLERAVEAQSAETSELYVVRDLCECAGPALHPCLPIGQPCLVKLGVCCCALERFVKAQTVLEKAWSLLPSSYGGISDRRQRAEILNNLACLFYLKGDLDRAANLFSQSVGIQESALDLALYVGSKLAGNSISLSLSIATGNVGFVALVKREVHQSITHLEASLKVSRSLESSALARAFPHHVRADSAATSP